MRSDSQAESVEGGGPVAVERWGVLSDPEMPQRSLRTWGAPGSDRSQAVARGLEKEGKHQKQCGPPKPNEVLLGSS